MRTPIDYTGNGRIDPVDIGIAASLEDDSSDQNAIASDFGNSHNGGGAGCLTAVLAVKF
jgi:hypothetical protein